MRELMFECNGWYFNEHLTMALCTLQYLCHRGWKYSHKPCAAEKILLGTLLKRLAFSLMNSYEQFVLTLPKFV